MDSFEKPKFGKQKIQFDDSVSGWTRFRYKYLTLFALQRYLLAFFRYAFLLGIAYVILFPYYSKVSTSFMTGEDLVDVTVKLVPKYPTLDTYRIIFNETEFWAALKNTAILSLFCSVIQMIVCALVGYGLSKFKFKGQSILFALVILTLVVPHKTLQSTMKLFFQDFNIWGLYITNLTAPSTHWPMFILSIGAIGYRNGLYIFMMRQFFKGVPDELEEAAYVDGAGVMKTFWKIIIPMSVPMMVTVFIFSFSWQWTDKFYTKMLYNPKEYVFFHHVVDKLPQADSVEKLLKEYSTVQSQYLTAMQNAVGLLVLIPLIIVFLFGQKKLIQGIERTGVTG